MSTKPPIIGLGEILWDMLPTGRQLGGAPCNFAFHCHQLGHPAVVVSRIGKDQLGQEIRQSVVGLGLADTFLQTEPVKPTGTVSVALDRQGKPTFTITPDVAWDHVSWNASLEKLFGDAAAVCFGTLAQRSATSRKTIARALTAADRALIVFDINLRQQFYSRDIIEASLAGSDWLKLNDDELAVLRPMFGLNAPHDSGALAELREQFDLELVCLTRGADGCLVQTASGEMVVPGERVQVVDTVGAGDAFTAGLLVYALEGRPLNEAARFANRLAGRVAAAAGATPRIDRAEVEKGGWAIDS
jgi:fructokinase